MGRVSLQRLLTGGLMAILALSFLLSAAGVAWMVRNYLWRSGVEELQAMARPVERFLERRESEVPESARRRRADRLQGPAARGFRRFAEGRGEVYLLRQGEIVRGLEDSDLDWGRAFEALPDGVHLLEHDGERWQVLSRRLTAQDFDQLIVARRWSPFLRIVGRMVLYQVLVMTLVLGLATVAVRLLSRRIAGSLQELREWSERLGQSKVETLRESRIAEVASLQQSFLRMGDRVETALEAQRQFVADASHELRTPLTAVSGMLELVESRPEMSSEDRQQALSVAKTETARMVGLVSDLLTLSRAQARRSGQRLWSPLSPTVEEQLSTLKVLFPEQTFVRRLDPEAKALVNPDAFARVVRNLLENAAKYGAGNPVTVAVEQEAEGVVVRVEDGGPGIPEERLPELFERFTRLDSGRVRGRGGYGLGLAIVKALVEEMEGELTCQSRLGEGSRFQVLFRKTSASQKPPFSRSD